MLAVIKTDLLEIKAKYGDARRTQIVDCTKGTLTTTDLLPDQQVWVSVAANGDLRRQDVSKPSAASVRQTAKGSEVALLTANTRDFLHLFAKDGRVRRVAIHEIPQNGDEKHLADLTDFTRRDDITAALSLPRDAAANGSPPPGYLFLVTEQGMVKRVTLADFLAGTGETSVMNVDEKDRLGWALLTQGEQEVVLVSAWGQAIRFREEDVRSMGLAAGGVGGMRLDKRDQVVYAAVVDPQAELITMTSHGFAKRSSLEEYPTQGRNGGGVVTHKIVGRTGPVAAALQVDGTAPAFVATLAVKGAPRVLTLDEIPPMGRGVQGKQVVDVGPDNAVKALRIITGAPGGPVTPAHEDDAETPHASAKPAAKPAASPAPVKVDGHAPAKAADAPVKAKGPEPSRASAAKPAASSAPVKADGHAPAKAPDVPVKAKAPEPSRAAAKPAASSAPVKADGHAPAKAAGIPVKAKAPDTAHPAAVKPAASSAPVKADGHAPAKAADAAHPAAAKPAAPSAPVKADGHAPAKAVDAPVKAKPPEPSRAAAKPVGEKPAKPKPDASTPLEQGALLSEPRAAVPTERPANPRAQKLSAVTSVKAPKKKS